MSYVSFLNTPVSVNQTFIQVLLSIKGIGSTQATKICKAVGVLPKTPFSKMGQSQRTRVETQLQDQNDLLFESSLKRKVFGDIRRLLKIKHYRGLRLQKSLPVRGQRTKTNASTARRLSFIKG